jgi:uncharacterized RDD family membrane protein YckC
MPFCPRCGTQNFETAESCQQCGSPLPTRQQQPSQPVDQPFGGQPPQPPQSYSQPPQSYSQPPQSYSQPPQSYQPVQSPGYGASGYGGYQQQGYGYGAAPQLNYAGIGKRFGALLLDFLIGFGAALPGLFVIFLGGAMTSSRNTSDAGVGLILLGYLIIGLCAIAVWIYQIYLLGRDGSTLGKRWMNIRVLDQSGQPLGFGKAFLRELVKAVLGNICVILLLWPLWDPQKQGLYDKILTTNVYEA